MSNPVYLGDTPHLFVQNWVKLILYALCLVPSVIAVYAFIVQATLPSGDVYVATATGVTLIAVSIWLFGRLYFFCSIDINSERLKQSYALPFGKQVHLSWDEIERVSFSRFSYHFVGKGGLEVELNTTLFGNAAATIESVEKLLPARLQTQNDLRN